MVRAVPVLAIILLAVMWLESNKVPVFVAFLMAFPIFEQNIQQGIRQTDSKLIEVAQFTTGASATSLGIFTYLPVYLFYTVPLFQMQV